MGEKKGVEMQGEGYSPQVLAELLKAQKTEVTEYCTYLRLAKSVKDSKNAEILLRIGNDEGRHAELWEKYTGRRPGPDRFRLAFYTWLARILGLTFGLRLMERGEERAQINYERIMKEIPEGRQIHQEEKRHENELIGMIQEERLAHLGSIVLGLNDALVELTGALAGMTFALQNSRLVAVAGLVTGFAASLSMAASEYLSQKSEGNTEGAFKAAAYTGFAYIVTVILLVLPYLLLGGLYLSLGVTLITAILIIAAFNFYISVAKDLPFGRRFAEMAILSLTVAVLTFSVGYLLRATLGVED
ncbi:MAG: VIT1/CCC1 transporter family protein [Acidobacteriota bacterium]